MKYDDYSWHYGGDFPKDLPDAAGATHIAMFVAWALLNGLAGETHISDFVADLDRLRGREMTPVEWFLRFCDGKFTDQDLNDVGNRFAGFYYEHAGAYPSSYLRDYDGAFPEVKTLYHVPDGWAVFEKLAPIIQNRFSIWEKKEQP